MCNSWKKAGCISLNVTISKHYCNSPVKVNKSKSLQSRQGRGIQNKKQTKYN